MSDLRHQVRAHYDAHSLSPEKVSEIVASGRAAAAEQENPPIAFPVKRPWGRYLSLVAAVVVMAFVGSWWAGRDIGPVSYTLLAPRVIEFFSGTPDLAPASQDKRELKAWLVAKGAPAGFQIPAPLMSLESAACQVVDVKGEKAYMSCYWTEKKAERGIHELVHLLVARAEDFHDQPKSTKPVIRELDGWSFASWTDNDILYTMATAATADKLSPLLSANKGPDFSSFMSFVVAEGMMDERIPQMISPSADFIVCPPGLSERR